MHYDRADRDAALADYESALKLDPGNPDAYWGRAAVRRDKGDLRGAQADYERALEVAPRDWQGRSDVEGLLRELRGKP